MTAGRGNLEAMAEAGLPAQVGEVGQRRRAAVGSRRVRIVGDLAGGQQTQVGERGQRRDAEILDQARLPRVRGGNGHTGATSARGLLGHRQHARQGADRAIEGELAGQPPVIQGRLRDLPRRAEDRRRDREIEARAGLAQVGRRQVGGDPLERELEAAVDDRRAHPLAGLPDGGVREPDEREGGQPAVDVDLDVDGERVDALEGEGSGSGEHRVDARAGRRTCGALFVPIQRPKRAFFITRSATFVSAHIRAGIGSFSAPRVRPRLPRSIA